jgi:NifU-like protein
MGREALEAAIENYRSGKRDKKILSGKVICNCFGVTEEEIRRVVRENGLSTVDQVTNYTKAGGGCGKCKGDISQIIDEVKRERVESERKAGGKTAARRMTTIEKIRLIEQTLEREIRPLLKNDGGDIELIDVEGSRVKVALRGMCAGCQVSRFTLKDVVEVKLREFVSSDLTVEEAKE